MSRPRPTAAARGLRLRCGHARETFEDLGDALARAHILKESQAFGRVSSGRIQITSGE
jgi:hypothetical protein